MAQFFLKKTFTVNCVEKTKIKKKRPGRKPYLKETIISLSVFDDSRVYNLDSRSELLSYSKVVHYDRR